MDEESTSIKCSFCGKTVAKADSITHCNQDNEMVVICKTCVASGAHILGLRHVKDDTAKTASECPSPKPEPVKVLTPRQIYNELKRSIIGQDSYCRMLSLFGYRHLKRTKMILEGADATIVPQKANAFVLGATGTGKTFGIQKLCSIIGIPYHIQDMTKITATGYVGGEAEDLLRAIMAKRNDGLEKHSIIACDEIDKNAKRIERTGGRDILGEGVQYAMLKIIEGMPCDINTYPKDGDGNQKRVIQTFDTGNLGIIALGAFSEILLRDSCSKGIGFISREAALEKKDVDENDLIIKLTEYGMLPEFLGRFSIYQVLNPLSVDDMKRIINDSEESIVEKEIRILREEGIELLVEDSAIEHMARAAYESGLGARNITNQFMKVVENIEFEMLGNCVGGTVIMSVNSDGELVANVKERRKGHKKIKNGERVLKAGGTA